MHAHNIERVAVDGIVHVTAKDKATNKDQSMTIASSSGLSDKDIERMLTEAEEYAETDKARKSLIEASNNADSVCADTEKGMSCGISYCRREAYNIHQP